MSVCTLTHVHTPYTAGAVTRFEWEFKSHLWMNKTMRGRIWKVQASGRVVGTIKTNDCEE